jgi:hypothetical protein
VTRLHPPLLLPLALACLALALVAAPARGATDFTDPNAPLPLGPKRPCGTDPSTTPGDAVTKVPLGMAFGFLDPNDPNSTNLFTGLPSCASLCKKAGSACQKYVKRLASCENHAIDDRATFVSKTPPSGLTVDDANDPNTLHPAAEHTQVNDAVTAATASCNTKATQCAEACNAP